MKLNYSIEGRDFPVSQAIIEATERCLKKIYGRYDMQYTDVTLEKTPNGFKTTFASRQTDGASFVATGEHEDCYAALSQARDRMMRKIKQSREKHRDQARHEEGLGRALAEAG